MLISYKRSVPTPVYLLIRKINKELTPIHSYGRQTTEDNSRKRAPRAKVNCRAPRVLNIEVVIILTTSSLITAMAVVYAVPSCIFRSFNIFCLLQYFYVCTLPQQAHCLISLPNFTEVVRVKLQWVRPGA